MSGLPPADFWHCTPRQYLAAVAAVRDRRVEDANLRRTDLLILAQLMRVKSLPSSADTLLIDIREPEDRSAQAATRLQALSRLLPQITPEEWARRAAEQESRCPAI